MSAVARPQYQTGYGTGPVSKAKLWRRVVDTDQEDYRAARAAAAIAIRLFTNTAKLTNSIEVRRVDKLHPAGRGTDIFVSNLARVFCMGALQGHNSQKN